MQDKWRKKEANCHIGYHSDPVKKHVSSNMSCTQLQAKTPLSIRTRPQTLRFDRPPKAQSLTLPIAMLAASGPNAEATHQAIRCDAGVRYRDLPYHFGIKCLLLQPAA